MLLENQKNPTNMEGLPTGEVKASSKIHYQRR